MLCWYVHWELIQYLKAQYHSIIITITKTNQQTNNYKKKQHNIKYFLVCSKLDGKCVIDKILLFPIIDGYVTKGY